MTARPAQLLLGRIRRRARLHLLVKHTAILAALLLSLLALFGLLGGAIPSRAIRYLFWGSALGSIAVVGWRFAKGWAALQGPKVARLVAPANPSLASRLQSLAELESGPIGAHSPALLDAHLHQTDHTSARQVSSQLMPWPERTLHLGAASALSAAIVLLWAGSSMDQRTAMMNLLSAGASAGTSSDLSGHIVTHLGARVVFPSYLRRQPKKLTNPESLKLPVGTYVDFEVTTIEGAEEVFAAGDETVVALSQREGGVWRGRWVVRKPQTLHFRATINGESWRDRQSISLLLEADQVPALVAEHRSGGETANDPITVGIKAADDFGLASIHLVLRGADGQEVRKPLLKSKVERKRRFETEIAISPAEVGAIEGDTIEIWAEAHDNDDVSGPKVGKSNRLAVRIGQPPEQTAAWLEALVAAFEAGLVALADTLEDLPAKESLARTESALVAAQKGKVPKEVKAEIQKIRTALSPPTVENLEDAVLKIQELITSQQRVAAAAIMREVEALRQEMDTLVERLISSKNPQTQRELLATLRRLQNKMAELSSKLTSMGVSAPQDFANPGRAQGAAAEAQQSTFEKVQAALEAGNYEALQRHLIELRRSLDGLAESFQKTDDIAGTAGGGRSARQERAERLLSEFLDRINAAEVTERGIMRESQRVAGLAEARALLRATSASGLNTPELKKQIQKQRRDLGKLAQNLSRETGDERGAELAEEIEGQLGEVEAALDADRYFEALDLLQRAEYKSDQLSRDLRVNALMFPGRGSEAQQMATTSSELRERLEKTANTLRDGIPDPQGHVDPGERQKLRQALKDQQTLEESVTGLSDELDAHLPGLAQQVNPLLKRAREHMRASGQALKGQQLRRSIEAQRAVLRELEEIRMATQKAQSGGGGSQTEADGAERVVIPGEDKNAADDRRRKIIDGMRQDRMPGFEHETGAYFEELLR